VSDDNALPVHELAEDGDPREALIAATTLWAKTNSLMILLMAHGMDLATIQSVMGHGALATAGRYPLRDLSIRLKALRSGNCPRCV